MPNLAVTGVSAANSLQAKTLHKLLCMLKTLCSLSTCMAGGSPTTSCGLVVVVDLLPDTTQASPVYLLNVAKTVHSVLNLSLLQQLESGTAICTDQQPQ